MEGAGDVESPAFFLGGLFVRVGRDAVTIPISGCRLRTQRP